MEILDLHGPDNPKQPINSTGKQKDTVPTQISGKLQSRGGVGKFLPVTNPTGGDVVIGFPGTFIPLPTDFYGSMPEQLLHEYLDKSLVMLGMFMSCAFLQGTPPEWSRNSKNPSTLDLNPPIGPGPSYESYDGGGGYDPTDVATPVAKIATIAKMIDTTYQLGQDLQMIQNIKPKMITSVVAYFGLVAGTDFNMIDWSCASGRLIMEWVWGHVDNEIIFRGAIPEGIDNTCNNIEIPDWILVEYGFVPIPPIVGPGGTPGGTCTAYHIDNLGNPTNKFDVNLMVYTSVPPGAPSSVVSYPPLPLTPDPTVYYIDTQMWIYYCATKFMDAGMEGIELSDIFQIQYNDRLNGYAATWDVVQRIRAYGRRPGKMRRGLVLVSATTNALYYNDPTDPRPDWGKKLILDYQRNKIPFWQDPLKSCMDGGNNPLVGPLFGSAYYPAFYPSIIRNAVDMPINDHLLYNKTGGLHPQGWLCVDVPKYVDYDLAGTATDARCGYSNPGDWADYPNYGYSESGWFALQDTEHRNRIFSYSQYKVKCINTYAHVLFTGSQNIATSVNFSPILQTCRYRANRFLDSSQTENLDLVGPYGQEDTIAALYNTPTASPMAWLPRDFTNTNVIDSDPVKAASHMVAAGTNFLFFIGTDGYIHGFVKVNGPFNGGTWLTVSPSYACQVPAYDTVRAQGPLVSNPAGTQLLYVGIDNRIYGFDIDIATPWVYNYFNFNLGGPGGLRYVSNLIYATNDLVLFIGNFLGYSPSYPGSPLPQVVCGLQRLPASATWQIVVPALISEGFGPPNYMDQPQAADSLTYSPYDNRVYYASADGNLYYYQTDAAGSYFQFQNPTLANYYLNTNLNVKIVGQMAIYQRNIFFIGESPDGSRYVYLLRADVAGSDWQVENIPNFSTLPLALQAQANLEPRIALNADCTLLAFMGTVNNPVPKTVICYYFITMLIGIDIGFIDTSSMPPTPLDNSLLFIDNNMLLGIHLNSNPVDNIVAGYLYGPDHCHNEAISHLKDYIPGIII